MQLSRRRSARHVGPPGETVSTSRAGPGSASPCTGPPAEHGRLQQRQPEQAGHGSCKQPPSSHVRPPRWAHRCTSPSRDDGSGAGAVQSRSSPTGVPSGARLGGWGPRRASAGRSATAWRGPTRPGSSAGRPSWTGSEALLVDVPAQNVVLLHGPGGIGKSTLLRELVRRAERGRLAEPDHRGPRPPPAAARAAGRVGRPARLAARAGGVRLLGGGRAAHPHLQDLVLRDLPAGWVVVISGRQPPAASWGQDGWEHVTTELRLGPLADADALACALAHGAAADHAARPRDLGAWSAPGDRLGRVHRPPVQASWSTRRPVDAAKAIARGRPHAQMTRSGRVVGSRPCTSRPGRQRPPAVRGEELGGHPSCPHEAAGTASARSPPPSRRGGAAARGPGGGG